MNIRKLCTNGAIATLVAASAVAIAAPAQARLECNQQATCWWTGDTPEWQRANSDYYARKWNVRIVNGGYGDYDRSYYHGDYRDRDRDHFRFGFSTGYRNYDRDYDYDRDTY
jgi:hypothetical protein